MSWSIFLSGLGGSVLGAVVALVAVYIEHRLMVKRTTIENEEHVFNFLQALHDEIYEFQKVYDDSVGSKLTSIRESECLKEYYTFHEANFSVYDNGLDRIGRIRSPELRRGIVKTYSQAKSIINHIIFHNDILRNYEQTYWESVAENDENVKETLNNKLKGTENMLKSNTAALRSMNNKLKKNMNNLMLEFNRHGITTA